jgi:hypothetical protein
MSLCGMLSGDAGYLRAVKIPDKGLVRDNLR